MPAYENPKGSEVDIVLKGIEVWTALESLYRRQGGKGCPIGVETGCDVRSGVFCEACGSEDGEVA